MLYPYYIWKKTTVHHARRCRDFSRPPTVNERRTRIKREIEGSSSTNVDTQIESKIRCAHPVMMCLGYWITIFPSFLNSFFFYRFLMGILYTTLHPWIYLPYQRTLSLSLTAVHPWWGQNSSRWVLACVIDWLTLRLQRTCFRLHLSRILHYSA